MYQTLSRRGCIDLVIPREGVESPAFLATAQMRNYLLVIPREGVESFGPTLYYFKIRVPLVIPREGVERQKAHLPKEARSSGLM